MTYLESIRGYPYMHKRQLAEELKISERTIDNRIKEIMSEIKSGRYNDYALIFDGKIVLINVLVFLDYLTYRRQLLDKNARKYTPKFMPEKIMEISGWNSKIKRMEENENEA